MEQDSFTGPLWGLSRTGTPQCFINAKCPSITAVFAGSLGSLGTRVPSQPWPLLQLQREMVHMHTCVARTQNPVSVSALTPA